ncbi:MAG TPA: BPTI/Kunitz-type proteinase inhibitor domain-containing protein, partial [Polyangiaceae bacterium]|nr:BPTI/Kunitz-type proteinase inhibitor domain-containing protein [Polyangiaceae bacterium]
MKRPLLLLGLGLSLFAAAAPGCEGFVESSDGGAGDAAPAPSDAAPAPDASVPDASVPDASVPDASPDASLDAAADAGACGLPKVVGPCEAAIPRFWFNASVGRCEPFVYGGCGGNANNFADIAACAAACAPGVANACEVTDCGGTARCVFQAAVPRCAEPCDDAGACAAPAACGCGASCATCRD